MESPVVPTSLCQEQELLLSTPTLDNFTSFSALLSLLWLPQLTNSFQKALPNSSELNSVPTKFMSTWNLRK
jgi:hypothetical protein